MKSAVDQMPLQRKRARREEDGHANKAIAAKEVCDVISTQIKERFSFTSHHSAVSLIDPQKFSEYSKSFPQSALDETTEKYPFLDKAKLKTELGVFYRRDDIRYMNCLLYTSRCV